MLRERESAKIRGDMAHAGRRSHLFSRSARATGLGALVGAVCAIAPVGALAATPKAPALGVTVTPSKVRPGDKYRITITGSYDKRSVHTVPYLMAVIQYSAGACKSTVKAETALPNADWSWDFSPREGLLVPSTSFSRYDTWTARTRLGTRHVCVYLYAHRVSLKSDAAPLVTATTTFRDA
jgi:hypothetical protein